MQENLQYHPSYLNIIKELLDQMYNLEYECARRILENNEYEDYHAKEIIKNNYKDDIERCKNGIIRMITGMIDFEPPNLTNNQ